MNKLLLSAKEISLVALFVALTVIFAQVIIPLPFTPLPVSFGLVAVYLTGIFLPPKCAIAAQVLYLLMGAIGLPVFGGFQGGVSRLLGPTGGCLFAYPFMAAVISFALNRRVEAKEKVTGYSLTKAAFLKAFIAVFGALIIEYVSATLWLSFTMGITFIEAATLTILPFIVVDIAKVIVTVLVFLPVRSQLYKAGLMQILPKVNRI